MARKCRLKSCRSELPPVKQCETPHQQAGFCDGDCGFKHHLDKKRERLERKKQRKQKTKEDRRNDKSHQIGLTQRDFNAFIRALDAHEPCASCGKYKCGSLWDAGHVISVGANCELRFDPRNCFKQGSGCNRENRRAPKNSNRDDSTVQKRYKQRLRERYGDDYIDWLEGPHPIRKYSCDDLRAIRKLVNAERRRLERGEGPSRDWRSLDYDDLLDVIESVVQYESA